MSDALVAFGLGGGMALAGAGLAVGVRSARPDLHTIAAQLDITAVPLQPNHKVPLEQRLGEAAVTALTGLGRNYSRLEADLPIAGSTLTGLMGQAVILTVAGAGLGLFLAAVLATSGLVLPLSGQLAVVAVLALLCGRAPFMAAKQRAVNRRRSFVHTLGTLLDFLAIELAAGAGIKDGLTHALELGQGWAFELMHERVLLARNAGRHEWLALEELGQEIGVPELVELAGSVALARLQGATARDTLIAKARELRRRQITTAEADARRATERAGAPIAIQLYAVILTIVFVLMYRLTTGLRG
jgi:tight adherence protein C